MTPSQIANQHLKTSSYAQEKMRDFEGSRLTTYEDSGGKLTIGHGHTGPPAYPGHTITEAEQEALFQSDLIIAEGTIKHLVLVALDQGQFDALVDFVFNIGSGLFRGSTLLKLLNAGHPIIQDITTQVPRWVHDEKDHVEPGLVARRAEEVTEAKENL